MDEGRLAPRRLRLGRLLLAGLALSAATMATPARALQIVLSGVMGSRAALVVDGRTHVLGVGEQLPRLRLLGVDGQEVRLEVDGQPRVLRLGDAPVRIGEAPRERSGEVVLSMDPGGHFTTLGAINGRPVRLMVDTGATLVALSRDEAQRLGVDWERGAPDVTQTAAGLTPVHRVQLRALRIGEVEIAQVDAVVLPAPMPFVLLGNSALSRFQMRRDDHVMRLELRR